MARLREHACIHASDGVDADSTPLAKRRSVPAIRGMREQRADMRRNEANIKARPYGPKVVRFLPLASSNGELRTVEASNTGTDYMPICEALLVVLLWVVSRVRCHVKTKPDRTRPEFHQQLSTTRCRRLHPNTWSFRLTRDTQTPMRLRSGTRSSWTRSKRVDGSTAELPSSSQSCWPHQQWPTCTCCP
jgi:hypothetical protein